MPPRENNRRHSTREVGFRAGALARVGLALLAALLLAPNAVGALRPPVELTLPTISGKAQVGKTLTASRGSWTGSPTSYAYRWLRCAPKTLSCDGVGRERTYIVRKPDNGSVIRVQVTARNDAGRSSALSQPTAIVTLGPPVNTSPPVISGVAQQGLKLTASRGSWTGSPTSYAYRWLRCDQEGGGCTSIPGASGASYLAALADVGSTLRVRVTAANSAGDTSAKSESSELVDSLEEGPQEEEEGEEEPPPTGTAGEVKYRLDAKSYFDQYSGNLTFLLKHIDRILGYGSFAWLHYVDLVQTVCYRDAYTHWGSFGLTAQHIAEYEAEVRSDRARGCAGPFNDDIELHSGYHQAGTERQVAELVEASRRAAGPGAVVENNIQYADLWPRIKEGDPYAERILKVTDYIDKEFGVNSVSGINSPAAFSEYLAYVDYLHGRGIHIDQEDAESGYPGNEYELATYLLINDGGDFTGTYITPSTWWPAYDTNLGAASGPREHIGSVYRRKFVRGTVYVDPPGGATQTVDGHTLKTREGLVVVR
jgi:Hypothetical glycosyl hydrolase family 15